MVSRIEQKYPAGDLSEPTDSTPWAARTTTGRSDRCLTGCCRDCDFRESFCVLCDVPALSHCCGTTRRAWAHAVTGSKRYGFLFHADARLAHRRRPFDRVLGE